MKKAKPKAKKPDALISQDIRPGGLMFIHAQVHKDGVYIQQTMNSMEAVIRLRDWLEKYIEWKLENK